MPNNEYALQWLRFADADLKTALHLDNTMYPKPLEIICFHCQQCAEKSIKAVLELIGAPVERTHDISVLLDSVEELGVTVSETLYAKGSELIPYGVIVRYPHELYIDEALAKKALENAQFVHEWAEYFFQARTD